MTLVASLCVVAGAACIKAIGRGLPTFEVLALRSLLQLPILAVLIPTVGLGRVGQPRALLVRSALHLGAAACYIGALQHGGLAEVEMVRLAKPLMVVLGAALFLGERIGRSTLGAVCLAALGTLLIIDPFQGAIRLPIVLAMAAVLLQSTVNVVTRALAGENSPMAIVLFQAVATGGVGAAICAGDFVMPTPLEWVLASGAALSFLFAHLFMAYAFRLDAAGVVASTQTSKVGYALILGLLLFGELPTPMALGGALLQALAIFWLYRARRGRQIHARHGEKIKPMSEVDPCPV